MNVGIERHDSLPLIPIRKRKRSSKRQVQESIESAYEGVAVNDVYLEQTIEPELSNVLTEPTNERATRDNTVVSIENSRSLPVIPKRKRKRMNRRRMQRCESDTTTEMRTRADVVSIDSTTEMRTRVDADVVSTDTTTEMRTRADADVVSTDTTTEERTRADVVSTDTTTEKRTRADVVSTDTTTEERTRADVVSTDTTTEMRTRADADVVSTNTTTEERTRADVVSTDTTTEERTRVDADVVSTDSTNEMRTRDDVVSTHTTTEERTRDDVVSIDSTTEMRTRADADVVSTDTTTEERTRADVVSTDTTTEMRTRADADVVSTDTTTEMRTRGDADVVSTDTTTEERTRADVVSTDTTTEMRTRADADVVSTDTTTEERTRADVVSTDTTTEERTRADVVGVHFNVVDTSTEACTRASSSTDAKPGPSISPLRLRKSERSYNKTASVENKVLFDLKRTKRTGDSSIERQRIVKKGKTSIDTTFGPLATIDRYLAKKSLNDCDVLLVSSSSASNTPVPSLLGFPSSVIMATKANISSCFKGSCVKSCGNVPVTETDLMTQCADQELFDNVIDAYLETLMSFTRPHCRVLALPVQLGLQWNTHMDYQSMKDYLYETVRLDSFNFIMIPLCVTVASSSRRTRRIHSSSMKYQLVQGQHWMLLVADIRKGSVAVVNSLATNPNYVKAAENYIGLFRLYMSIRSAVVEPHLENWNVSPIMSSSQTDGSSCGVFVAMAADAICSNVDPSKLSQDHANQYRHVMFTRLKERLNSERCASLVCVKPTGKVLWVQCDNCSLWHHFVCEKVKAKPAGHWFCASCACAGRH